MRPSLDRRTTLLGPPPLDGVPWLRRRWLALSLAAACLLSAFFLRPQDDAPRSLDTVALAGARGPACLRVVVANDVSGSMSDFSVARQEALAAFLAWAPGNLRSDDEIGVLDFAADAQWLRAPTTPSAGDGALAAPVVDGSSTLLTPVLGLTAALPASRCDTKLVLLSDAQLGDLPADAQAGREALVRHRIHDVALLVPAPTMEVPPEWEDAYPQAPAQRFDGTDVGQTGLTFASTIAGFTGQRLVTR